MYYAVVMIAVLMFGLQFLCNQKYQQENGNGPMASMLFIFGTNLIGLLALLGINRFRVEYTHFTLLMAAVTAFNSMACSFCSLKALSKIDLSLYSLFSMLGGMALPFCAGILFFDEALTLGKGLCLLTVAGAMLLTLQRSGPKGGNIYYAGIFVFNGMSGVLSKLFQAASLAKTDAASYSIWSAALTAVFAGAVLLCLRQKTRPSLRAIGWMAANGVLNKVANFLLLLALVYLPASLQYPMVTGGVIIVSTLMSYFTPQKPKAREVGAVVLSFMGILLLVLL